jgi:hypothetical protein
MSCKEAKLIKRKIENFVSEEIAKLFDDYAYLVAYKDSIESPGGKGYITKHEDCCGHCIDIQGNNEPLAKAMLNLCHKKMEEITAQKLEKVRSFYRIYTEGSYLKPHIDDKELEYSVTLNMGSKGPEGYCWPIYIEDLDGKREDILLHPTDALVYNGSRIRHGRDKFIGLYQTQLFLHYKEKI